MVCKNTQQLTEDNKNKKYWLFIWSQFKEGDKEAFAIFYNLHIDQLFKYGLKLCNNEDLLKDVIQEIFLDLYLKREKNSTTPENLKYYLFLALKRNLIKKLKSKRRFEGDKFIEGKMTELEFSIEYHLIEKEQDEEIRSKVVEALNQLPDKQKEVIYLRFNEAMDYQEIAMILGITIESVRKQVYRALKTVRELIDNKRIVILFYFFKKKVKKSVHV